MVSFVALLMLFVSNDLAASTCSDSLIPTNSIRPSAASGYEAALVATGLTKPRSITFDTLGNLLVVEQGVGITNLVLQDDGGLCLGVKSKRKVISNSDASYLKRCQGIPD
jgi:glucose/arabinose dehydrogenase